MKRVTIGIVLLAGVAAGQQPLPPAIAEGASPGDCIRITAAGIGYSCGAPVWKTAPAVFVTDGSIACPSGGCPVTHGTIQPNDISDYEPRRAPSNEVVMQALEYGKTYSGKAVDIQILPRDEEAFGILLAITAKVNAGFAIVEVLHREVARIAGRDLKLFRSKTQAVRVSEGGAFLSDPIPLKLEDVEKINVRLVTESNVVEFWSDTSEVKAKREK